MGTHHGNNIKSQINGPDRQVGIHHGNNMEMRGGSKEEVGINRTSDRCQDQD